MHYRFHLFHLHSIHLLILPCSFLFKAELRMSVFFQFLFFVTNMFNFYLQELNGFLRTCFLQKPESITYKKASDWVTEISLFDHWIQRYVDSLAVQVICHISSCQISAPVFTKLLKCLAGFRC